MKKFLSLLLSLLLCIFILPLSGCGSGDMPEISDDTSEILKLSPSELHVDWEQAVNNAFTLYEELYAQYDEPYIIRTDILSSRSSIKIDSGKIVICADILHGEYEELTYAITGNIINIMRCLNQAAQEQDNRIPLNGPFSCGGIFDVFETEISVYTSEQKDNPSQWLIKDTLKPGEHRERCVHLQNGSIAPPLLLILDILTSYFPSDNYPLCEQLDIVLTPKNEKDDTWPEKDRYKDSLVLFLNLKHGTSDNDALAYSDSMLRLFNRLAHKFDSRIAEDTADSYGGLYDLYIISPSVSSYNPDNDTYRQYVAMSIHPDVKAKLELYQE